METTMENKDNTQSDHSHSSLDYAVSSPPPPFPFPVRSSSSRFSRSHWHWPLIDYQQADQLQAFHSLLEAAQHRPSLEHLSLSVARPLLSKSRLISGSLVNPLLPPLRAFLQQFPQSITELTLSLGIDGLDIVPALVSSASRLRVVDLSRNIIHCRGVRALAGPIAEMKEIQQLNLAQNILYPDAGHDLARILLRTSSLSSLVLDCNKLGSLGVGRLAAALGPNSRNINSSQGRLYNTTLERLSIDNNRLGPDIESLCLALRSHPRLRSLSLGLNDIEDAGAQHVAALLAVNSTITHVNISDNSIGPLGCKFIMAAVAGNSSLKSLDLSWNLIGSTGLNEGPKSIGRMLNENRTLDTLRLSDNQITPNGLHFIVRGAVANARSSLSDLDLSINPIGCDGVDSLCALMASDALKVLNIARCSIEDTGVGALAAGLQRNRGLHRLILCGNSVKVESNNTAALIKAYSGHRCLIELALDETASTRDRPMGRAYRKAKCNQFARVLLDMCPLPADLARLVADYTLDNTGWPFAAGADSATIGQQE